MDWKKQMLGMAVASALSGAVQAADNIVFDTNGAALGGQITVGSFDWTPGNALADNALPLPGAPATNTFTLYAQASLGNFLNPASAPILGTGLGSAFEITFQAGFSESGTQAVIPGVGVTTAFSLPGAPTTNFFNIYYDTAVNANSLMGTGYGDGTLIMSGIIVGNTTTFLVPFTIDSNGDGINDTIAAPVSLDQFPGLGNNYPTVGTFTGSGGGQLTSDVTSQDFAYFVSNISSLLVDMFTNTNNITPFNQIDPSASVVGITPTFGAGIGSFTAVNGNQTCQSGAATCDFLFQADANTSFNSSVPEPGSLALAGLALAAMGLSGRHNRKYES